MKDSIPFGKDHKGPEKTGIESHLQKGLDGARRLPQQSLVLISELTLSLLEDPNLSMVAFRDARITREQVGTMMDAMHRAHIANHIPVASAEMLPKIEAKILAAHGTTALDGIKKIEVKEADMQNMWDLLRIEATVVLAVAVGLGNLEPDQRIEDGWYIELDRRLQEPSVRSKATALFRSIREALATEKGRGYTGESYRLSSYRKSGPLKTIEERDAAKLAAIAASDTLRTYVFDYAEKKGTLDPDMRANLEKRL